MPAYMGINGVVKNINSLSMGVGGVKKTVSQGHIGINGVNKPFLGYKAADIAAIVFKPNILCLYKAHLNDYSNWDIISQIDIGSSKPAASTVQTQFDNAAKNAGIIDPEWIVNIDNRWIYTSSVTSRFFGNFDDQHGIQVVSCSSMLAIGIEGYIYVRTTSGKDIYIERFLQPAQSNISTVSAPITVQHAAWYPTSDGNHYILTLLGKSCTFQGNIETEWVLDKATIAASNGSFNIAVCMVSEQKNKSNFTLPTAWTIDGITIPTSKLIIE